MSTYGENYFGVCGAFFLTENTDSYETKKKAITWQISAGVTTFLLYYSHFKVTGSPAIMLHHFSS